MSSSGCHWRCAITPRSNILRSHGALSANADRPTAHYSSGMDHAYFGWTDAKADKVVQLAEKFRERFPDILEQSQGDDWEYAGWYVCMLDFAEQGGFPIAYASDLDQSGPHFLPLTGCHSELLMPPPGEAEETPEE